MDLQRQYLVELLQKRESETSELRKNLHKLRTEFFQLERAFEINLRLQRQREVESNCMNHKNQELRKQQDEILRTKAELNTELWNANIEKDHWRNAFLQQRESINRSEIECDNTVTSVTRKCEDILKVVRETAEKQFHELIELYNGANYKMIQLEKQTEASQSTLREYENRSFELANLLETLKRFNVDVDSVCQLVAEILKNLCDQGNLFEESMKNLRRLTWTTPDKNSESELNLLRKQNSILKEVVRNLKRKIQLHTRYDIPERDNDQQNGKIPCEIERNSNKNLPNDVTNTENCPSNAQVSLNMSMHENLNTFEAEEHQKRDTTNEPLHLSAPENENRKKTIDIQSAIIDRRGAVLCIETHSNGVYYEEYVFKLAIDGEMKIKYPVELNDTPIKIEFVDNESEYENAPLNRISIFLKNIYASVNVKQTGVSCGTQTVKMKTNNFTQTTLTGINSFSRLNVGATMLNSEKRAIEKSLCKLERTVETLKFNELDQVRTVLGND